MRFRLFGTEIYVSFLFCAVVSFMLATDRTGYCLPTLTAAMFHEFGHLFAMWVCDCQPKSIRLVPASVSITGGFPRKKYGEIFVALSGPLVNILIFLSLAINYKLTKGDISLAYGIINLIIGVFNLLPVKGLDGGTVLLFFLEKKLNNRFRAEKIVKLITVVIGALTVVTALVLILNRKLNISALIVGIYILLCGLLRE